MNINESEEAFIQNLRKQCRQHGVSLKITKGKTVRYAPGFKCDGYFCTLPKPEIVVAGQSPIWFPVLIHESCHMDQWIEVPEFWETGTEAMELLDGYFSNQIKMTPEGLVKTIISVVTLERDCEERTAKKIIDNNLPIDVKFYNKKANAYLFWLAAVIGYDILQNPVGHEEFLNLMPDELLDINEFLDQEKNEHIFYEMKRIRCIK